MTTKLTLIHKPKKTCAEEILSQLDDCVFNEDEITRLVGGSAANGDKNDPVVFTGAAEHTIRRMVAKYGLDRLPLTYGEFQGMQDYCALLDIIVGEGVVPLEMSKGWSKVGIPIWAEARPQYQPAHSLYVDRNLAGLLQYHKSTDAMTRLGKDFIEFSEA